MRAHLGGLPLEAKEEEVRQWLREANPSAQFWVKPARQPGAWRVSVTCSVGQPHIPEIFRGKRIVQIAPGEDRPLRADHRLAFIRAAGVEWPQQMQEYLKNHHIVVEVSDIWRSEVAWSSGRWDGTFCVMATPEQREAIDALKRESRATTSSCKGHPLHEMSHHTASISLDSNFSENGLIIGGHFHPPVYLGTRLARGDMGLGTRAAVPKRGNSLYQFRPTGSNRMKEKEGGVGVKLEKVVQRQEVICVWCFWMQTVVEENWVGVVCLADVSLSPGWTECFASEVGPRLILRISDIWPLRCLSDRLVRWKILLWDVADAARSLGERMWPLILVGLVKGIIQFQYWTEQMGAPMPASAQNLRRNGQLWTMTGGDARAGQGVNGQTRTPLTPAAVPAGAGEEGAAVLRRRDALGIVTPGVARERVEDNLAKMWQANLTEWYEENPEGDNLKKEENPAVGDNLKKEENPAVGDNLKKEENPAVGDNLKGQRWATSAGWGMDMMEENPKKGDNLKKEENPGDGGPCRGWECVTGWRHRGHTTLAQVAGAGFLFAYDSFEFRQCSWDREVWKGRLARISWMRVIMYAWGTWKV
ncbi:hypothetical protein PAPYR_12464 [Paratrimastix pyriformis]|uniref:Uncharacterized protein n=1 Tax=Paratrimastix pyriformis TaxID=342808 RepID=A0ABQ8U5P0_9EUKA|nr:hypothetical protein PAPYR_12464 [Paratrimastix pyriformis]